MGRDFTRAGTAHLWDEDAERKCSLPPKADASTVAPRAVAADDLDQCRAALHWLLLRARLRARPRERRRGFRVLQGHPRGREANALLSPSRGVLCRTRPETRKARRASVADHRGTGWLPSARQGGVRLSSARQARCGVEDPNHAGGGHLAIGARSDRDRLLVIDRICVVVRVDRSARAVVAARDRGLGRRGSARCKERWGLPTGSAG